MGSGKSSVGKLLAESLACEFYDLDDIIVKREGKSVPEIFTQGEQAFRKVELAAFKDFLTDSKDLAVLALGGGTFTIEEARHLALSHTTSIYLRTKLATIKSRLGESDSSRPLFANAQQLYELRSGLYSEAEFTVDTDNLSPEEVSKQIIDILFS